MKKYLFYLPAVLLITMNSCVKEEDDSIYYPTDPVESISELVTLKSGVVVERNVNDYIWLGDLILSPIQLKALDEKGTLFTEAPEYLGPDTAIHPVYNLPVQPGENRTAIPRAVGVYPTSYNLWAMVRFRYADDLTPDRKNIAREAMLHWQAHTNIRFYNASNQPTVDPTYGFAYPYVEFTNSNGNNSYVGRKGGKQIINLAQFQPTRVAIHEIGHAIGLFHEQSAYNRDNYINLNLNNVPANEHHNFQKITSNYYAMNTVDFNSVMIYDSYGFAIDPSIPVMTKKADNTTFTQGSVLSFTDKKWTNTFYIPYIARSDTYRELADVVYKSDNTIMTEEERLDFQASLNNGNPYPPSGGRIPNNL